jgi:hypothetical protein
MAFVVRLLLPIAAISSSFLTYFMYRIHIISGRYGKIIKLASSKLKNNLTNQGVVEYMSANKGIKQIPNTDNLWQHISNTYDIVKYSQSIDQDIKTQLRIMLRLKGVKNI